MMSEEHRQALRSSHRTYPDVLANALEGEEWRDIPGWPSCKASSFGRITEDGFIRKSFPSTPYRTRLYNGSKTETVSIAALVLLAFVGPAPVGKELTRHLDDDPQNMRLSNLAWGSRKDNTEDAIRNGKLVYTKEHGEKISASKKGIQTLSEEQMNYLKTRAIGFVWITDGIKSKQVDPASPRPKGWGPGMTKKKPKRRRRHLYD